MKILWVEDDPEGKIHQFSECLLHFKQLDLSDCKSFQDKLNLLQSVGFVLEKSFRNIIQGIQGDKPIDNLFKYFNKYDLIFCDVNLTDKCESKEQLSQQEYDDLTQKTRITFCKSKEGEALFLTSILPLSKKEKMRFANKFYFFSSYDLKGVQETIKVFYPDLVQEWAKTHCIINLASNNPDDFKPYNFKDTKYDRFLRASDENPWNKNDSSNSYTIDIENDNFHNIEASIQNGKWTIHFSNSDNEEITLIEGNDFCITKESLPSTSEFIINAISNNTNIQLELKYKLFFELDLFKNDKESLLQILKDYETLIYGFENPIEDNTIGGDLGTLRAVCTEIREKIIYAIIPKNFSHDDLKKVLDQKDKYIKTDSLMYLSDWSPGATLDSQMDQEINQLYQLLTQSQNDNKQRNSVKGRLKNLLQPPKKPSWTKLKSDAIRDWKEGFSNPKLCRGLCLLKIFTPHYIYESLDYTNELLSSYPGHQEGVPKLEYNTMETSLKTKIWKYTFIIVFNCCIATLDFYDTIRKSKKLQKKFLNDFIPFDYKQ